MSHASRLVTLISLALVATAAIGRASAGTPATWIGAGGNGLWATSGNWTGSVPDTTDTFDLVFGGTNQASGNLVTTTNSLGTVNVSSLAFTNNNTTGSSALFTLKGSTLVLNSSTISTASATTGAPLFIANSDGDRVENNLTLAGTSSIVTNNNHNLSLLGVISGSGSLLFDDGAAGTTEFVYLGGTNTYSGGSLIRGGFVQTAARVDVSGSATTSNNAALGTGPVTVSDNGTLLVRNSSVISNQLTLSGSGAATNPANAAAMTGSFGIAGQTAEYQGPITLDGSVRITTASAVTSDTTSKLLISGNVDLGANLLSLRSRQAATGLAGLLIQITGTITGTGGVDVNGDASGNGRVLISGSNTYTGGTTVTSGTLAVGHSSALGTGFLAVNTSGLDLNGQTLSVGALSGSATGVIQSNTSGAARLVTSSTASSTYAGRITNGSGTVGLTKAGSGTLTLTGSNGFTGSAAIDGGVLALGGADVLAGGGDITFGSGTMQYSAANTLDYSTRITNSSAAVAIDTNGQTITYAGAIPSSNVAGLTKSGSGALYLNAVNQFTGTTTVVSGTLGGNGSVTGPVVVSGSSVIAPGATANSFGTFGLGGLAVTAAEATVMLSISGTTAGTTYDQFDFSAGSTVTYGGKLDLSLSGSYANGTAFDLFKGFASASGHFSTLTFAAAGSPYDTLAFTQIGTSGIWQTGNTAGGQYLVFNEGTGQLVVVPEPSSLVLVAMAAGTLAFASRRRRRAA